MDLWTRDERPKREEKAPIPLSEIDRILVAQFAVAWAGEGGEEKRLGWWRSDLVSEFGGEDLFRRLLPQTWAWAVLQGAREAARRKDAELRAQEHDPDKLISLFRLGFELDERIEERLQDLKREGQPPTEALPALRDVISDTWSREAFLDWVRGHGAADATTTPAGRRVSGPPPKSLELVSSRLVAALDPLPDAYPLPHFRSGR